MKKIVCLLVVMVMAFSCISVFAASSDVPSDLPAGAYKIMEGVYAVKIQPPTGVQPMNDSGMLPLATVPVNPNILQPINFNNIILDSGHKYLIVKRGNDSGVSMGINLVSGTQNVFGTTILKWPGVSSNLQIYIEAAYYNITSNKVYQLQCSSTGVNPISGASLRVYSSVTTR